ncbi:MAG: response regulator, partial [Desulfobulbaceae bacterium]|nr:response regulator [Desulfobulbaceae bacterium]
MRILETIDDDTAVLTSCQRIFTEEGFKVTTTTNPSEGIDLASNNQYT